MALYSPTPAANVITYQSTQLRINFLGITFLYSDWSRSLRVRRRETGTLGAEAEVKTAGMMEKSRVVGMLNVSAGRGSGVGVTTGEAGEAGKDDVNPGRTECSCFIMKSAQKNSNSSLCTLGRGLHEYC